MMLVNFTAFILGAAFIHNFNGFGCFLLNCNIKDDVNTCVLACDI